MCVSSITVFPPTALIACWRSYSLRVFSLVTSSSIALLLEPFLVVGLVVGCAYWFVTVTVASFAVGFPSFLAGCWWSVFLLVVGCCCSLAWVMGSGSFARAFLANGDGVVFGVGVGCCLLF